MFFFFLLVALLLFTHTTAAMLTSNIKPCPLANERLNRRNQLEESLQKEYNVDLRYDSRLCLNYINNQGKVLPISAIAAELKLMDHLYHQTAYSRMMGTLLNRHWRYCNTKHPIERNQLSDRFSAYCKDLIAKGLVDDLVLCTADDCHARFC